MNLLFLAPRLPLPADTGGKIRTFNILKQLAKENRVLLLCFSFEASDHSHIEELKSLGIEVEMVPITESSTMQKALGVTFNSLPFSISKYQSPAMATRIRETLAKERFDAIHIDHLHMAVYKNLFNGMPCFLDEHNVEYKILERCSVVEKSWIKKFLYQNQSFKMMNFESNTIKEFNTVFACSSDDASILDKLNPGKTKIHVIANGVDTEYFKEEIASSPPKNVAGPRNDEGKGNAPRKGVDDTENAIVFTGSMDWLPNDDAISYFCKDILPLAWQKNEALKLYVVGKNPSKPVKELAQKDNRVIVTGRVDDVRPFVLRSSVFIVPLRIGGGTRLKILEAMAMSKAVVSTTIGAEGIECENGRDIAIADSPEAFAKKINDLCYNPAKCKELGQKGRELVCQKYDWTIMGKKINSIYQENIHASK